MEQGNYLTMEEAGVLDLEALVDFWDSAAGKKIRAKAEFVQRELPFTASFAAEELDEIFGKERNGNMAGEFIVVQGVADLAVLMPKEIWLVDFKTDSVRAKDLAEKAKFYSPQLKLYARALEKIYGRPVTNCWLHFLDARETVVVARK